VGQVGVNGVRLEGPALVAHPLGCAVISVINERGYELAGVEEFLERSGTSREEFDRHFSGKADVTLRVMEAFIGEFKARVAAAFESGEAWPDNLRAAAYEAARWLTENPKTTHFGMVTSADAGDMPRARREEIFRWCASLIEAGREVAPDPGAVPAAAPLMVIGAVAETLRRQQEGTTEADTVAIVPHMMYAAVRPYLGEEAARRELEIPPPPDLASPESEGGGG
jgi:AcrR family transcriptional regulator